MIFSYPPGSDDNPFPSEILIDSGADYSILRYDIAKDALGIPVETLPKTSSPATGISGKRLQTVETNIGLTIPYGARSIENLHFPVKIILDKNSQPQISLLGRVPFFHDFRIDFRMGYTDDKSLGKFVLYHEDKKRKAVNYKKPFDVHIKK